MINNENKIDEDNNSIAINRDNRKRKREKEKKINKHITLFKKLN